MSVSTTIKFGFECATGRAKNLADAMGVSTGTIIIYQRNIHAKLGVHSRAELLAALLPA